MESSSSWPHLEGYPPTLKGFISSSSVKVERGKLPVNHWTRNNYLHALHVQCKYTAVSKKAVGESACDNPERYCGWF